MKNSPRKNKMGIDTIKDELGLQGHLLEVELKGQMERIEKDWQLVRSEVSRIIPYAKRAVTRSALASRPLIIKVYNSLLRIQDGFRRHHETIR